MAGRTGRTHGVTAVPAPAMSAKRRSRPILIRAYAAAGRSDHHECGR
jgi:hypothetical protein